MCCMGWDGATGRKAFCVVCGSKLYHLAGRYGDGRGGVASTAEECLMKPDIIGYDLCGRPNDRRARV